MNGLHCFPRWTLILKTWITQLLLSAGFSKVEVVGNTDAYKNEVRRALFIARP